MTIVQKPLQNIGLSNIGMSKNKINLLEHTTALKVFNRQANCKLKVLFDSGSDRTMFKRTSIPKDIQLSHGCK
jgi:hypothetical protein